MNKTLPDMIAESVAAAKVNLSVLMDNNAYVNYPLTLASLRAVPPDAQESMAVPLIKKILDAVSVDTNSKAELTTHSYLDAAIAGSISDMFEFMFRQQEANNQIEAAKPKIEPTKARLDSSGRLI